MISILISINTANRKDVITEQTHSHILENKTVRIKRRGGAIDQPFVASNSDCEEFSAYLNFVGHFQQSSCKDSPQFLLGFSSLNSLSTIQIHWCLG